MRSLVLMVLGVGSMLILTACPRPFPHQPRVIYMTAGNTGMGDFCTQGLQITFTADGYDVLEYPLLMPGESLPGPHHHRLPESLEPGAWIEVTVDCFASEEVLESQQIHEGHLVWPINQHAVSLHVMAVLDGFEELCRVPESSFGEAPICVNTDLFSLPTVAPSVEGGAGSINPVAQARKEFGVSVQEF